MLELLAAIALMCTDTSLCLVGKSVADPDNYIIVAQYNYPHPEYTDEMVHFMDGREIRINLYASGADEEIEDGIRF